MAGRSPTAERIVSSPFIPGIANRSAARRKPPLALQPFDGAVAVADFVDCESPSRAAARQVRPVRFVIIDEQYRLGRR